MNAAVALILALLAAGQVPGDGNPGPGKQGRGKQPAGGKVLPGQPPAAGQNPGVDPPPAGRLPPAPGARLRLPQQVVERVNQAAADLRRGRAIEAHKALHPILEQANAADLKALDDLLRELKIDVG
ncbi:MAG TPA: hypothetical protein VNC50_07440, partial [Planctomycetia bacterium]|nr:hypothetical protein [Planctomycetia bacterium]